MTFRVVELAVPVGHCVVSAPRRVAGRLAFPAPPSALGRRRPGPRGLPRRVALARCPAPLTRCVSAVEVRPRGLCLSFRALPRRPGPLTAPGGATSPILSWDSLTFAPLPFDRRRVHSRRPRPPSGRWCHPPTHVPPSWFLTTSAAFSAPWLRVCCTPLPALGFDAFRGVCGPDVRGLPGAFSTPRIATLPFEEFPSSAAVPHHCGRCPLAVATFRSGTGWCPFVTAEAASRPAPADAETR